MKKKHLTAYGRVLNPISFISLHFLISMSIVPLSIIIGSLGFESYQAVIALLVVLFCSRVLKNKLQPQNFSVRYEAEKTTISGKFAESKIGGMEQAVLKSCVRTESGLAFNIERPSGSGTKFSISNEYYSEKSLDVIFRFLNSIDEVTVENFSEEDVSDARVFDHELVFSISIKEKPSILRYNLISTLLMTAAFLGLVFI